jgi:hypothetical protein
MSKGIKVKNFIKELQKLDQERNIWVRYDGVYFYAPTIDEDNISEWEAKEYLEQGIKEGDYTI